MNCIDRAIQLLNTAFLYILNSISQIFRYVLFQLYVWHILYSSIVKLSTVLKNLHFVITSRADCITFHAVCGKILHVQLFLTDSWEGKSLYSIQHAAFTLVEPNSGLNEMFCCSAVCMFPWRTISSTGRGGGGGGPCLRKNLQATTTR